MRTRQPPLMNAEWSRALADPLRASIVDLLSNEQMCTCHLVEATGASQSNISNHLRVLREAGLVADEPFGRFTYHRLVPGPLLELSAQYRHWAQKALHTKDTKRACN